MRRQLEQEVAKKLIDGEENEKRRRLEKLYLRPSHRTLSYFAPTSWHVERFRIFRQNTRVRNRVNSLDN